MLQCGNKSACNRRVPRKNGAFVAFCGTELRVFAFAQSTVALQQELPIKTEGRVQRPNPKLSLHEGTDPMRFSLPLIALAAIAAPVAAVATPADTTVTVKVAFDDLDVTTPEGRAALEARIDAKTRSACTIDAASRYAYGRPVIDEVCMAEARAKALATADRIAAAKSRNGSQVAAN